MNARVPLTSVKTIGKPARRKSVPIHPIQVPKSQVLLVAAIESSDPLQAGISIVERETRLRAYQRGADAFTVAEFARLVRGSTTALYAARQTGKLHMTSIGSRKWIISIADAAAYIGGTK